MSISFINWIDTKETLSRLQEKFDSLEKENRSLRKQLASYNQAKEIKEREETINNLRARALHIMSDKEWEDYSEFHEKHYKVSGCKNPNHYIFDLTGTAIGTAIEVTCPVCGEKKDITDYKSW